LRERLLAGLRRRLPEIVLNGDPEKRVAGNLNIALPGIDAEALLEACDGLALSTGSACSSAAVEPSYVLRALGLDEALARAAIRIGLGRFTTEAEVDYAVDALAAAAQSLRQRLPAPMKIAARRAI
jgi:cysteine desulfurase